MYQRQHTLRVNTIAVISRMVPDHFIVNINCWINEDGRKLKRAGFHRFSSVFIVNSGHNRYPLTFADTRGARSSSSDSYSINRCKVPGCGKPHHSLLHQSNLSLSRPDHRSHLTEGTSTPAIPTGSLSDPSEPTASVNTSVAQSPEIFLQVIPLKVIGKNGRQRQHTLRVNTIAVISRMVPDHFIVNIN